MSENVLVVAFDGLDKEWIEEFELENIMQEEFGAIDNQTGMKNIYTSELFASFITGKNPQEHGIDGLTTWSNQKPLFEQTPKLTDFHDKIVEMSK